MYTLTHSQTHYILFIVLITLHIHKLTVSSMESHIMSIPFGLMIDSILSVSLSQIPSSPFSVHEMNTKINIINTQWETMRERKQWKQRGNIWNLSIHSIRTSTPSPSLNIHCDSRVDQLDSLYQTEPVVHCRSTLQSGQLRQSKLTAPSSMRTRHIEPLSIRWCLVTAFNGPITISHHHLSRYSPVLTQAQSLSVQQVESPWKQQKWQQHGHKEVTERDRVQYHSYESSIYHRQSNDEILAHW